MTKLTDFRCVACGLVFQTDLHPDETRFCPYCGERTPETVTIVADKMLCEECAGVSRNLTLEQLKNEMSRIREERRLEFDAKAFEDALMAELQKPDDPS